MNAIKVNRRRVLTIAAALIFVGALMYCVPLSLDDWAWGGKIGIERFETMFKGYNGRYLGNFLILAMSRSKILRVAVMTLVTVSIPLIISKYVNSKRTLYFVVGLVLLFVIPSKIYAQTLGWASGFSNYVPPIAASLFYLMLVGNIWGERKPEYKKYLTAITFFTGVFGGLFMEHITLFNVALAVLVILFVYLRFKKVYAAHIGFFAGSVVGAAIMFSNSSYLNILSQNDETNYRSVAGAGTGILETLVSNAKIIYPNLVENNVFINVIMCALALIIVSRALKTEENRKKRTAIFASFAVLIAYVCFDILVTAYPRWSFPSLLSKYLSYSIKGLFAMLFLLALAVIPLLCIKDTLKALRIVSPILFVFVLTVPLFVVTPLTARCFFPQYLMYIVYSLELLNFVMASKKSEKHRFDLIKIGALAACFTLVIYYGTLYSSIHYVEVNRTEYVLTQVEKGEKEIDVPKYPYASNKYVWGGTFKNDKMWEDRYKAFYNIDESVDLTPVDFTDFDWKQIEK